MPSPKTTRLPSLSSERYLGNLNASHESEPADEYVQGHRVELI